MNVNHIVYGLIFFTLCFCNTLLFAKEEFVLEIIKNEKKIDLNKGDQYIELYLFQRKGDKLTKLNWLNKSFDEKELDRQIQVFDVQTGESIKRTSKRKTRRKRGSQKSSGDIIKNLNP